MFQLTIVAAAFFSRGVTTACLNLVGKHPVESDVLKSTSMNGKSLLLVISLHFATAVDGYASACCDPEL